MPGPGRRRDRSQLMSVDFHLQKETRLHDNVNVLDKVLNCAKHG